MSNIDKRALREAETVAVTDDMAYAFHHALSDSSLGADEVEEIKDGLRAAFANVTSPPAPVSVPECFKRLLHHAYGMTMGHDWNKGTMAGHHRAKLCQAVEDCRAAMLQGADVTFTNEGNKNHPEDKLGMVNQGHHVGAGDDLTSRDKE